MNELENLRPEVREAVQELDGKAYPGSQTDTLWQIIRAELLRLAKENADLLSTIDLDEQVWVQRDETMHRWIERARNAEAELTTLQNTINAQQDTMGALKRKLALVEAELAAVRETSMELSSTNEKLSNSSRYKPL